MKIENAKHRREFLAAASLAVPAALAGASALRGTGAACPETSPERPQGYRETAHVLAYYKTTQL